MNRDPIEELGGENIYASVFNNPVNSIDLFGQLSVMPVFPAIPDPGDLLSVRCPLSVPRIRRSSKCSCPGGGRKGKTQNPNWNDDIDGCSFGELKQLLGYILDPVNMKRCLGDKDDPMNFGWPVFYPACAQHDKCYQTCDLVPTPGKGVVSWHQKRCDDYMYCDNLRACMRATEAKSVGNRKKYFQYYEHCKHCAKVYYTGLRHFGRKFGWEPRQKDVCTDCCCP